MKTNRALKASAYIFKSGERILVDTNIWLFLLPPSAQPTPLWGAPYSLIFKRMLAAKTEFIVETTVLSEYVNRFIRVEYGAYYSSIFRDYKSFRKSADFPPVAQAAVAEVAQILKFSSIRDTPLQLCSLSEILTETEAGKLDLNDGVLIETCRIRGWKLLTHDADMTIGGIDVLTENRNLLKACP